MCAYIYIYIYIQQYLVFWVAVAEFSGCCILSWHNSSFRVVKKIPQTQSFRGKIASCGGGPDIAAHRSGYFCLKEGRWRSISFKIRKRTVP